MSNIVQLSNGMTIHESLFRRTVAEHRLLKTRTLVIRAGAEYLGAPEVLISTQITLNSRQTAYFIGDVAPVDEKAEDGSAELEEKVVRKVFSVKTAEIGVIEEPIDEFMQNLATAEANEKKPAVDETHVNWVKKKKQQIIDLHTAIHDAGAPSDDAPPGAGSTGNGVQDKLDGMVASFTTWLESLEVVIGDFDGPWYENIDGILEWLIKHDHPASIEAIDYLTASPIASLSAA